MSSKMGRRLLAFAAVSALTCTLNGQGRGQTPARPVAPKCEPTAQKLTLSNLVLLLNEAQTKSGAAAKREAMDCVEQRVQKQSVTFKLSAEIGDALRLLGATPKILSMIQPESLSPPPPPAPRLAGPLSVSCDKPECSVIVNSTIRPTAGGLVHIPGLPIGRTTLVVYKDGFQLYSNDIDLTEKPLPVTVALKENPPDPAMPVLKLNTLLWTLVSMTGRSEVMEGTGTVSWVDGDKTAQWQLGFKKEDSSGPVEMNLKNSSGKSCKVTLPSTRALSCDALKTDPANVLDAARLFAAYHQPDELIQGLAKRKLVGFDVDSRSFRTDDSGPDSFRLTVDNQGLLGDVQHKTQSAGARIQYLDYKDTGKGKFPFRMVITPDGGKGKWEFGWDKLFTHDYSSR